MHDTTPLPAKAILCVLKLYVYARRLFRGDLVNKKRISLNSVGWRLLEKSDVVLVMVMVLGRIVLSYLHFLGSVESRESA